AVDRTLEQDRIIAPRLVAFLWRRIVAIEPPPASRVHDRFPTGHHPDFLIGDKLQSLLPAVPEGTKLPVSFVLDQELHDEPELVGRKITRLGNPGILGVLEINCGKD